MPSAPTHSGEMSQDSAKAAVHPKGVIDDPASRRTRGMFETLTLSSMGLEFGLSVIIGLMFGRWLDSQAGTDPWLMIVFLCFGFAAGLRSILRAIAKADRLAASERETRETHGG
jgi:F0F1-type ATP synthase assembly protein I